MGEIESKVGPKSPEVIAETAREIRDTFLDLVGNGTLGSEKPIPKEPEKGAVKISSLLRYSASTLRHFKTLTDALAGPREFTIISEDYLGKSEAEKEEVAQGKGDVVYTPDYIGDVFSFPHELTSPYLNPRKAALDKEPLQPFVDVCIVKLNGKVYAGTMYELIHFGLMPVSRPDFLTMARGSYKGSLNGCWEIRYSFSQQHRATVFNTDFLEDQYEMAENSFGYGGLRSDPRRTFLLTFCLIPSDRIKDGKFLVKNLFSHSFQRSIHALPSEKVGPWNRFDVYPLVYDGNQMDTLLSEEDRPDPMPEVRYSRMAAERYIAKQIGRQVFNILRLGQVTIEGEQYSIVTASEQPLVKEEVKERVPNAVLSPVRVNI